MFAYYLKSQRFSDAEDYNSELFIPSENIFDIIFGSWHLWKVLGDGSKTHRNRLKELEEEANEMFNPKPGERGTKTKNADDIERNAIVYFLIQVSGRIELVSNGDNLEYCFPLRPPFFLLSDTMKAKYRQECDISDSNTKMMELMDRFQVFKECMQDTLENYRYNKVLYFVAHDDSYIMIQWVIYMFVLVANAMLFSGYKTDPFNEGEDDDGVKIGVNKHGIESMEKDWIVACQIVISILSGVG